MRQVTDSVARWGCCEAVCTAAGPRGRATDGRGHARRARRATCKDPAARRTRLRGVREGEDPRDLGMPAMAEFAQPANRLAPPEAFLYQFAFDLTDGIPRMSRRPVADRARRFPRVQILRDMRRDAAGPDVRHEVVRIIALVRAQRAAPRPGLQPRQHLHRRPRSAPGARTASVATISPCSVVHQHAPVQMSPSPDSSARSRGVGVGRQCVTRVAQA